MIVVRDCWMRTRIQGPPVPSWGSWMLDVDFPDNHIMHESYRASSAGNFTWRNNSLLETPFMALNT